MKRKTQSMDIDMIKAIGLGDRLDRKTKGYRREWPEQVDRQQ